MDKHLKVPFTADEAAQLRAGDMVYLTGVVYTARDAAHKRMNDALDREHSCLLTFPAMWCIIWAPPRRAPAGLSLAGPTTASRMDKYAPRLLDLGLRGMIGKGKRTQQVADAIVRNKAVYFAAVGGAGALLSKCIKKADVVAYNDQRAIRRLEVENLPVIVVIDSTGIATAPEKYHID